MRIECTLGDITQISVNAIVNAANSSLMGGGGVDGAIHRAGGPSILRACEEIVAERGDCPPGKAVITTAGRLPAKWVIHTVGPRWSGGKVGEPALLADCYRNSLALGVEHGAKSISFPGISTGVYGYPKDLACKVAVEAVTAFLEEHPDGPVKVVFVCFDEESLELYRRELGE